MLKGTICWFEWKGLVLSFCLLCPLPPALGSVIEALPTWLPGSSRVLMEGKMPILSIKSSCPCWHLYKGQKKNCRFPCWPVVHVLLPPRRSIRKLVGPGLGWTWIESHRDFHSCGTSVRVAVTWPGRRPLAVVPSFGLFMPSIVVLSFLFSNFVVLFCVWKIIT